MKVSVIIPCRNEENFIKPCLLSVLNSDYPSDLLEILVCDGQSTDNTTQIVEGMSKNNPQLRLVDNPYIFTPHALNVGIKSSRGEIIVILGAHSELTPSYVSQCVATLNRLPEAGCVGGMIKNIPLNETSEIIALAMASGFGVGNVRFRTGGQAGFVDTVAFGAYRREVFEKAGLFNEALVRNQDDELNFRIIKAGYKIYFDPDIRSNYYVRGSWKGLIRQYYQYGYWKVYVNIMHRQITTWRQVVPFFFVMFILLGALFSILFPAMFPVYLGILSSYFVLSAVNSFKQSNKMKRSLQLMYAFLLLHLSYGMGFVEGVVWLFFLRNKPHYKKFRLSR